MKLVIESLNAGHNRSEFQCASEELNLYLRHYAMQDQKRRLNRCYVLADADCQRVIGFYTLSVTGISRDLLAPLISSRKLGKYETIPAFLLGRLAVDQSFAGQGYGRFLLQDAIFRTKANEFSGLGLTVKAKNDAAMSFYLKNGFTEIEPLTAFLAFVSSKSTE